MQNWIEVNPAWSLGLAADFLLIVVAALLSMIILTTAAALIAGFLDPPQSLSQLGQAKTRRAAMVQQLPGRDDSPLEFEAPERSWAH